jgi:hypothetical protein
MKLFPLADVIEFRRDARDRSVEIARQNALRAANDAARKAQLEAAPMRDLDDLIPVLSKRYQVAKAASDKALQELTDALAEREGRSHG